MSTNCFACGYRDNEIKSGGAVADKGKKITLKVEDEEDLSRDMLKVGCGKVFARIENTGLSQTPVPSQLLHFEHHC